MRPSPAIHALETLRGRALRAAIIFVSVFVVANAALACRSSRGPYVPVATLEQAQNPKPNEMAFIGKIIERAPAMKFEVVQRIKGMVPAVVTVNLLCMRLWGEVSDTIPVIAVRDPDSGLVFGVGGGYDRAPNGWPESRKDELRKVGPAVPAARPVK